MSTLAGFDDYRTLSVLSEGGMGTVWRAEHALTGETVALKTARGERAAALAALRDEGEILRRVAHPGIVRVLAEGTRGGAPWYAMELVLGESLADLVATWWRPWRGPAAAPFGLDAATLDSGATASSSAFHERDGAGALPEPTAAPAAFAARPPAAAGKLRQAATLIHRIALALSAVHRQGVVHRDLKPSNIVVRQDGTPVLLDFGLAVRARGSLDREALTSAGAAVGSASYMAPEQVLGQFVDARADLYAIGCIYYELVTGQPPFSAASAAEILEKHVLELPRLPSTLVLGVPPELDALLMRLLAKRRRERIGHASELADAVEAFGVAPSPWPETPEDAVRAQPYLYRPELVGREDTLARVAELVRSAAEGEGGFALVGGESGVGKTFVVAEIARRARKIHRMAVVLGECVAVGVAGGARAESAGGPLHVLRPLLRAVADACVEGGTEVTTRLLGARGPLLRHYEPALGQLPGQEGLPQPAELPPEAARERLIAAVADTLVAFCEIRPTLLVLDDLQWADELSLWFLATLASGARKIPRLLVLGTYRAEEANEALRTLVTASTVTGFVLRRLTQDDVSNMVSDMLALASPPEPLVRFLTRHAEGNPFFVAEYLRAAATEGHIDRSAGTWRLGPGLSTDLETLGLPSSLREIVTLRLSRLTPTARRLSQLLSVFGRESDRELAIDAAGLTEEQGWPCLQELASHQIVETSAPGVLRFVHDKLREAAYAELAGEDRRVLHAKVAHALEARGSQPSDLAFHFRQAGRTQQEAHYAAIAGCTAQSKGAHREAIAFLTRALSLLDRDGASSVEQGHLHLTLGHAYEDDMDHEGAARHFSQALRAVGVRPPQPGLRGLPTLLAALAEQVVRRWVPLKRRDLTPRRREELLLGSKAMASISTVFLFNSEGPAVLSSSLSALNLGDRAGATNKLSIGIVGAAAATMGLDQSARAYFARLDSESADPWERLKAAHGRLFLGTYLLGMSRLAEADEVGRATHRELAELGDTNLACYGLYTLAIGDVWRGDLPEARYHLHLALQASTATEHRHRRFFAGPAAFVAILRGRLDEAEELLSSVAGGFTAREVLPEAAWLGVSSLLRARRGDPAAVAEAASAIRLFPMPRASSTMGAVILIAAGWALLESWEAAHARGAILEDFSAQTRALRTKTSDWVKGHPIGRVEQLLQEGRVAWLSGKADRSRARLSACFELASRTPLPLHCLAAHHHLAATYPAGSERRASHENAARAQRQALGLT